MASFNAQTAYVSDYQWFDDVVDATHAPHDQVTYSNQTIKVRPLSRAARDYREYQNAVQLGPTDRIIIAWEGDASGLVILPEDKLTFTDVSGVSSGWRIADATLTNRGYWVIAASKIAVNA